MKILMMVIALTLSAPVSNVFAIEKEQVTISAWGAGHATFAKDKFLSKDRIDRISILPMTEAVYDMLDSLDMSAYPSQSYKCKARLGVQVNSALQVFSLDSCSLIQTDK